MKRLSATLIPILLTLTAPLTPQSTPPSFIGLGDSVGEGVQSANASTVSQPASYLNLFARQAGVPFPLPLIQSGPLGIVYSTFQRSRVTPATLGSNLSVSGANVHSILYDQAGTPIADETDLVLFPRTGSQIQIAEALRAPFQVCWIGSDDVLGSVLSQWDHLDGTQLTPLAEFATDYGHVVQRLGAWGGKVLVGNLPDVTRIGWVFDPQDLMTFLGSDFGLPQGSHTTLPVMLLIKLGLDDGSILRDPNFVLDPLELQAIRQRTQEFNQVIAMDAAQAGMAVVDLAGLYGEITKDPLKIGGLQLTNRFLGGLFSLDGVHPSNIGHAMLANAFIDAANHAFGMSVPPINPGALLAVAATDPFVDWNGNLKVRGRPSTGLLETLGPFLGISGDEQDALGTPRAHRAAPKTDKVAGQAFMRQYLLLKGKSPATTWALQDAIAAMHDLFRFRHP